MISQNAAISTIVYPADWEKPPFNFGDQVLNLKGTRFGTVTGLSYCAEPIESINEDENCRGWWIEIRYHPSSPTCFNEPVELVRPSVLRLLKQPVQRNTAERVAVLQS